MPMPSDRGAELMRFTVSIMQNYIVVVSRRSTTTASILRLVIKHYSYCKLFDLELV